MNDACPICGWADCTTYPLMLERWAQGRDREHWRGVHDRLNSLAPTPPADHFAGAGNAIPVAEASDLVRRMNACRNRRPTTSAGCGCALCDLGRGAGGVVYHRDCFACPDLPETSGDSRGNPIT